MSWYSPFSWRLGRHTTTVTHDDYNYEYTPLLEGNTTSEEFILRHPWAVDFDLEDENQRQKANEIARLSGLNGQAWFVSKAVLVRRNGHNSSGTSPRIASLNFFPTLEEIEDMVKEDFGGGIYNITCKSRPSYIVYSHKIDGKAKTPSDKPSENGAATTKLSTTEIKGNMAADALEYMKEHNADGYQAVAGAVLAKQMGIDLPKTKVDKEPSLNEKLIQKKMEEDPDFLEMVTARAVEKEFGKPKAEADPMAQFMKTIALVKENAAALGLDKGDSGMGGIIGDLMKHALDALKDDKVSSVLGDMIAARNQQPAPPRQGTVIYPGVDGTPGVAPAPMEQPQPQPQPVGPVTTNVAGEPVAASQPDLSNLPLELLPVLLGADLDAIIAGVKGEAHEFIQVVYTLQEQGGDEVTENLIPLIRDTDPHFLHSQIIETKALAEGDWEASAKVMLGDEQYKKAVELLGLLGKPEGLDWLILASQTCKMLEARIDEEYKEHGQVRPNPNGQEASGLSA